VQVGLLDPANRFWFVHFCFPLRKSDLGSMTSENRSLMLHSLASRRNPRQKVVPLCVMREAHDERIMLSVLLMAIPTLLIGDWRRRAPFVLAMRSLSSVKLQEH
jgi:hypothetical protein